MLRPLLLAAALLLSPAMPGRAQPVPAPAAYELGPLDQIEVNVVSFPDLKTVTRLASDGSVTLPLVGQVDVGGRSLAAAARVIEQRYAAGGFVKSPSVRVEMLDYQSRKVSVLGQVGTQGPVVLDRAYSVAEIIARAGGLAADAAETVVIARPKAGGGTERISVDLTELTGGVPSAEALQPIRPGDVIYVPRAATFSVIGEVTRAGLYRLTRDMTVQQALAIAGDITKFGTASGLKVRRKLPGATTTTVLPAHLDDVVQPGDVLIVRERLF